MSTVFAPHEVPVLVDESLNTPHMTCVQCRNLLRPPVQQTPCGHRMCQACIEHIFDYRIVSHCPAKCTDCVDITKQKLFVDNAVGRRLSNLEVFCTFEKNGCSATMPWKDLEDHEAICRYRNISYKDTSTQIPSVLVNWNSLDSRQELAYHFNTIETLEHVNTYEHFTVTHGRIDTDLGGHQVDSDYLTVERQKEMADLIFNAFEIALEAHDIESKSPNITYFGSQQSIHQDHHQHNGTFMICLLCVLNLIYCIPKNVGKIWNGVMFGFVLLYVAPQALCTAGSCLRLM